MIGEIAELGKEQPQIPSGEEQEDEQRQAEHGEQYLILAAAPRPRRIDMEGKHLA